MVDFLIALWGWTCGIILAVTFGCMAVAGLVAKHGRG